MPKTIKSALILSLKRLKYRLNKVELYNNTTFSNVKFLGKARIEPYCRLVGSPLITFGDNFYANAHCHFLGKITFGKDVMVGPKTVIWGRDHGIKYGRAMCEQDHISEPVTIGDDVWIGANVTILKGVKVGSGAVIGAGSVVTKNIPENAIAVGNPAKVVKYRESE
ncbi:transacetylase [Pseudoalteromonas sp. NBT06-2]|uniref:acyltransferase n=1 Tax=Pseudoalteromonas sp. NBT06-2 TaxID=2025950 RepID=UPI000BA64D0C|nr:DapH/DapD/GlmU-related protein [Pseudoalteromonas sp. NBT06-2]PAJ74472.1 transacetylase [Pseudoalteromonas sp. NBT06-2]